MAYKPEGYEENPEYQFPIERACDIVTALSEFYDEVAEKVNGKRGEFMEKIFEGMIKSTVTGADQEKEFNMHMDVVGDMQQLGLLHSAFVSCAYAAEAIRAQMADDELGSWRFVSRADYWLGLSVGSWAIRSKQKLSAADFAKRGANSRHAENRAMKAAVFQWCDEQMAKYKSMDSAAEAIAGKLVPVTFRTSRDWIADWKKVRCPGTP